ncbi:hypothetical protein CA13_21610 [Planctomycetes bacterium CA13]|uniref:BioF2-like acetyltransferase domain-containing protein n=1 Tax=Novipirellula herctigrandis TaxID=2527986 RepID=A0A5C5Z093_9BACT|nr:hypothetical protein CA13_21610 [Planctomycetes bacterium CA13]
MYRVERFCNIEELLEDRDKWNLLAQGIPFRETSWLHAWWKQFADGQEPYVLVARDSQGDVCGLMPFYRKATSPKTLRILGDNNVCGDFVSVLAKPEDAKAIAESMASFLIREANSKSNDWETIEIGGVSEEDVVMKHFASVLRSGGAIVHAQSRMHTWLFQCHDTWEDWLGSLSRRTRRKYSELSKRVGTIDGLEVHVATSHDQVTECLDGLIELHQRRWNTVGEPGTYSDERLRDFVHDVARDMCDRDRLHLLELQLDGKSIGSTLNFMGGNGCMYVYSTGYDIDASKHEPGRVLTALSLKFAHDHRMTGVEFLRGDEPYKQRIGAEPTRLLELRIVAPRLWAKVCHTAWAAQFELKQWARRKAGRDVIEVVEMALTS